MDERVSRFGGEHGLHVELQWDEPEPRGTSADATRGRLAAWVGDRLAWGTTRGCETPGFMWTWIEIVEHLATAWPYLEHEEADPLGLDVDPALMSAEAQKRWQEAPSTGEDKDEEILCGFLDTHDLSRSLDGAWLAPIWLLREGRQMRIWSKGMFVRERLEDALGALSSLGDAICSRLEPGRDPRAALALKRWRSRRDHPIDELIRISVASRRDDPVEEVVGGPPEEAWGIGQGSFQTTELLAVARMSATLLPSTAIKDVLARLRELARGSTAALDDLSSQAAAVLAEHAQELPHQQGYAVAGWFRAERGLRDDERFHVDRTLTDWGVGVEDMPLPSREIDAICCWGERHGPTILVNERGWHGRGNGRRATLAHELGHLLMDRGAALPVAEVLGGRVSRDVEARARAFAAELLLPREQAVAAVRRAPDLKAAVRSLEDRFRVSREIIAWQVRNGDPSLPVEARAYLRSLVSEPRRF
ncbi:MAG: ImmA/IrrE family metallo-endopeptidase [Deltaproteobacteria bacterium]|nr:ImmA/IrrE family metallo-endopeptidase [Deltaproteobacteria bacterium]